MLSRCYDFTLRIFLIYSALRWALQATTRLCIDLRFNWPYYNCIAPLLIALLIVGLLLFKERLFGREPIARFFSLSTEVGPSPKKVLHLGALKGLVLIYSCLSLCFLAALSVEATFERTLKTAACCFEGIDQYELAEKIYQRVKDKGTYSTLASWQTVTKTEDPRKFEPRNIAVARVYGSNSLEMADRYCFIANSIWDNDENGMSDEIAYSWFEKAERIYKDNNAPSKVVDCLSQMAVLRENQKKLADSTDLIEKAATVAVSVGKVPYDDNYAVLENMSEKKGLLNESIVFSKVINAGKQLAAASRADDDQVRPSTICIAVLLTVLASGLGQATLSEFSLNRLNRDFTRRAMQTTNNQLRFDVLNNSISVDLMQNNIEIAVVKSEYLLQLADGNSLPALTLPSNFDWLAKRRKVIIRREIFSGALAAVIGIVFV